MRVEHLILSCLSSTFLLAACSTPDNAGTTMETENSVALQVLDLQGKPIVGASARLRPLWFLPDTAETSEHGSQNSKLGIRNLTSDGNGWLTMEGLLPGTYRLEVDGDSVAGATEFDHRDTNNSAILSALGLGKRGRLEGQIDLPAGISRAWVQVYGSETQAQTDSRGEFLLDNLPQGVVRVRAIAANEASIIAEDLAMIRAERTLSMGVVPQPTLATEDPVTWRYSRALAVDDLISDWMLPVSNPTVVTLRLDTSNFDFSQAMEDGRDLRVTDLVGRPLVHQRVRWDSELGRAVVRIRVNPSTQDSLLIRWGHAGAMDPSSDIGSDDLWSGMSDSLIAALYTLTLATFENARSRNELPSPIAAGYWYTRVTGEATVSPAPGTPFAAGLQPAGLGRSGSAVHITYQATSPDYVFLGTTLGSAPRSLATMDSIVFWARGNSRLSVTLERFDADWYKAWMHIQLDSIWTRYSIQPSDFLPADGGGLIIGWEQLKDSVTNLTFFPHEGTEAWIDDITLYGVNRDDLR